MKEGEVQHWCFLNDDEDPNRERVGHLTFNTTKCPKCGSEPIDHEVRNYDPVWRDGDVYCKKCGAYVRTYDAG